METSDLQQSFRLERLKFVLQQIDRLNERQNKYVSLYQGLTTAILAGGSAVFLVWKQGVLRYEDAQIVLRGLLFLLTFVAVYVVASVLATAFSWMDYRREETRLFEEAGLIGYRSKPSWRSIWRWNETYLFIFVVGSALGITAFASLFVLPLMVATGGRSSL